MTSSYRDPNVTAALAYQAEQEQRRKAQEQPSFIDVAGRTALGLGVAALAGAGIARGLRRNAMRPVTVEDLGATAARAEENVRRAARTTTAPPPSRPAPPAGAARQQAAEEFTRQARAERPVGIQQISIQDLGPTFRTPSPTEQALTRPRLPAASFSPVDYLTQKGYVEAAATGTPYSASEVAQLSRRPLVDAADRLLEDRDLLKRVEAEEAALVNVQPEMRGEQSRQQSQVRRALSAQADDVIAEIRSEPVGSLVTTQQARTGFNVDQAINALDAAEDQQTGRVKIQLQRNEDLDMGQVEVLEDIASQQRNFMMEQDEPINRVASQLPDGVPVKQAEILTTKGPSFVQQFLQRERDEIASQMGELGLTSPSLVEKELARRIGPESYQYGSEYTKIKQQIELGLQDPSILQSSETPQTFNIAGGEFPINVKNVMVDNPEMAFRKPYISLDTAISSEQDFVTDQNAIKNWLGNIKIEVAPQLNKLKQEEGLLAEQHNILMYALNKKPDRELSSQFKIIADQLKENRSQQDFLNRRLSGATASAQKQLNELSKWTPSTLTDWSGEGTVVRPKLTAPDTIAFEAEGGELSNIERGSSMAQFGPEDLEIVPGGLLSGGRAKVVSNIGQDVGFDPKTGERFVVPLVDETGERIVQKLAGKRMGEDVSVRGRGGVAGLDTKSSIGIYGPELSEYGTSAQTKTGQYTQEASQVPSLVNPIPVQRTTGGYFAYPQQREADSTKYTQKAAPEVSRASVDVSENVRKARDPQALLRSKMAELGISAIGDFSPYPRRR